MERQILESGTILDRRYEIESVIGSGGAGTTYRAVNIHTQKQVAIKICHIADREHFLREARLLGDFSDEPAVVKMIECFEDNGNACLVMEFLDGITLREQVKRDGKWKTEKFVRLLMPVMSALEKMHRSGVVHRDISPDNIVILSDGTLRLLDFGSAKKFTDTPETKYISYKSCYSPPEQYEGNGSVGPFTDIYSLCATIYFAITGLDPEDVLSRLLFDELLPPSAMGADIAPPAEKKIMSGLVLNMDDRLSDIGELKSELDRIYPDLTEEERKAEEARKKRRKRIIISISLAAAVLLAVILYVNRLPLMFRFIDTETIMLDGADLSADEYDNCSEIVKERVDAFSDGVFLWKDMGDRKIKIEMPTSLFGESDPQDLVRYSMTRPMVMSVVIDQNDCGIFSQTGDISSVTKENDEFIVEFSEESRKRIEDALQEKDKQIKLTFDLNKEFDSRLEYVGVSAGDGAHVKLIELNDEGSFLIPDALVFYHLTREPSKGWFHVESEWKVLWENVNATSIKGVNQKNAAEIPGDTVDFRYGRYGSIVKMQGLNSSLLSFHAVLLNRFDSLGIPYAVGFNRFNKTEAVVRVPRSANIFAEELEYAGKSFISSFILGGKDSKTTKGGSPVKALTVNECPDGTFTLSARIADYNTDAVLETLNILKERGEKEVFLYIDPYTSQYAVAAADVDKALESVKSAGIIEFTRWNLKTTTVMNADSRHFADYLSVCCSQDAKDIYYFDSIFKIHKENGALSFFDNEGLSYESVLLEGGLTEEEESALKTGLGENVSFRYYHGTRNLTIYLLSRNVTQPEDVLNDIEKFIAENAAILSSGKVSSLNIYMTNAESEKDNIKPYTYMDFRYSFEDGRMTLSNTWVSDDDKAEGSEIADAWTSCVSGREFWATYMDDVKEGKIVFTVLDY